MKTKTWIIVTAVIFVVSGVLTAAMFWGRGRTAEVVLDGRVIERIDLDAVKEGYSFDVKCDGGYNRIRVEHGRICISDSDCPDCVCVRYGWLSGGSVPIVCMPHKLVIRIADGDDETDAVSGRGQHG
ncbi:MAG: NusG domain II-containing protein [Oscillospiraceae bacterium]|nr:NusG domain II-containing protein [Oscillospiraceae bacterium]